MIRGTDLSCAEARDATRWHHGAAVREPWKARSVARGNALVIKGGNRMASKHDKKRSVMEVGEVSKRGFYSLLFMALAT